MRAEMRIVRSTMVRWSKSVQIGTASRYQFHFTPKNESRLKLVD
jgi:hypothetical protein